MAESPPHKRQKSTNHRQPPPLIPGLPDHIAQICLSKVPPTLLSSVCSSWRRILYSPDFPPFLSLYSLFSSPSSNSIQFMSLDPISSNWIPLPQPPCNPPLLLRHPSFLSRILPIQSISVSGHLIVLAASDNEFSPALPRPLIFNPIARGWAFGPPLANPRRWCAAGAINGSVYVGSGIGSRFSTDVAKSMEKWELRSKPNHFRNKNLKSKWNWEKLKGFKDGRFSRDAIDAIGWRGKLCMVNVKGDSAKEGVVYDVERDLWAEMPEGMLIGWRGPVAAMEEEVMFVIDERKGGLRKYVEKTDSWEEVMESEKLKGAMQVAAGGGGLCVVRGDGEIVVVDLTAAPFRCWVVERPPGLSAVAVHVLPRMSRPDFLIF